MLVTANLDPLRVPVGKGDVEHPVLVVPAVGDEFVAKLRRLADALENGDKFEIMIAGERIYVPVETRPEPELAPHWTSVLFLGGWHTGIAPLDRIGMGSDATLVAAVPGRRR